MAKYDALPALERSIASRYGESPTGIANQYGINPQLFLGLIQTESGGDARALSSAGAAGLTQLMPGTAADLGLTGDDRYDPWANLNAGARYLGQLIKRFGNPFDALRAYNAGPGAASVDDSAGADYAAKVLNAAGMGDLVPSDAVLSDKPSTFVDAVKERFTGTGKTGEWITDTVDTLKGYGYSLVLWLVIGALLLFGVYALVTGKALAPAAA